MCRPYTLMTEPHFASLPRSRCGRGRSDESRINLELQGISYGSSPVRVTFDKPDSPAGTPVYSLYIQDVHVQPDAVLRIWYADSQDKVLAERTVSLRADDGR